MERRSLKTLLSQGVAGSALGTFLSLCVPVVSHPHENNFVFVIFFPITLVLGAVIGTGIGFVIWFSQRVFNRSWSVLGRMVISILFMMLLLVLFRMLLSPAPGESEAEVPWLYILACQVSFAIPTGMMTGSKVRPWRLIARGTAARPRLKILFRRDPIRISSTIQELRFSFLAGLPLRLTSLLGLMWFLFATACFLSLFSVNWRVEDWGQVAHLADNFIECLVITLYFAGTVFTSFIPRHKWAALSMAFFLHAPLAFLMINNPSLVPHYDLLSIPGAILISLWLLFLTGLMVLPVQKSELRVEYGRTEIRFGKQQWVKES